MNPGLRPPSRPPAKHAIDRLPQTGHAALEHLLELVTAAGFPASRMYGRDGVTRGVRIDRYGIVWLRERYALFCTTPGTSHLQRTTLRTGTHVVLELVRANEREHAVRAQRAFVPSSPDVDATLRLPDGSVVRPRPQGGRLTEGADPDAEDGEGAVSPARGNGRRPVARRSTPRP